jgi:CRISPR-associated exonuclease Cas4
MPPIPPDPIAEDALIPLSALQHHLFCPRQCALIHVEQLWAEDGATAEGRILHERVDAGAGETRPGVRVARGIALRSTRLGVSGRADAVEFSGGGSLGPRDPRYRG